MNIQDTHGRIRNIPMERVVSHIVNRIPQGVWFYIFAYIVIFFIGFLVGKI